MKGDRGTGDANMGRDQNSLPLRVMKQPLHLMILCNFDTVDVVTYKRVEQENERNQK